MDLEKWGQFQGYDDIMTGRVDLSSSNSKPIN